LHGARIRGKTVVKSAGRALDIIDHLAAVGSASFAGIAEGLELPRSSAHGLLRTLVDSGWVEQHPATRAFTLGLRAWQVGQRYDGHRLLIEIAEPVMAALSRSCGETVQLARLDGVENVYIAISPSPNPMRLASTVGMRLHAHATGIGKALLGTLDPAESERRLQEVVLPRLTPRTTTDVGELLAVIERGRVLGYSVDDEEFIDGCRCVALPVTSIGETGIASAMSVTMPTSRTDERWPHSLYEPLRRAVEQVRAGLGLPPQVPLTSSASASASSASA
jgi:DNA-binding IclR family transcriptional regulator